MNNLPVELKMKIFNEMIEGVQIKISIILFFDTENNMTHDYYLYEDYYFNKLISPFGKETIICKKITKKANLKHEFKDKKIKILEIKDIYKFIKFKMMGLKIYLENCEFSEFHINFNDEFKISSADDELQDDDWIKKSLKQTQLFLDSMW